MAIKFHLPDNTPKNKRRMTVASGGYNVPQKQDSSLEKYPSSSVFNFGITKNAQYAGSAANTVFTQPMFFSPLHTPQNWQIASKRLEQYQWMMLESAEILTEDYTYRSIRDLDFICYDIKEDLITQGTLYSNIDSELVYASQGEFRKPVHYGVRDCQDKRCFGFVADGYWREIEVTEEHEIFVFDGEKIVKKQAQDVTNNDSLIYPIPQCGSVSISKEKAKKIAESIFQYECIDALSSCKNENTYNIPELNNYYNSSQCNNTKYIVEKDNQFQFTKDIFELDKISRLYLLSGIIENYGLMHNDIVRMDIESKNLVDQIHNLFLSVSIICDIEKYSTVDGEKTVYFISLNTNEIEKINDCLKNNIEINHIDLELKNRFFYNENGIQYLIQPIQRIREFTYTGKGYDIQIDPERAFVASGYVISNCRFYYSNEPKVAAAVDFYSLFPMNGFKLECKSKKILRYYEEFVKDIQLNRWLEYISHEYYLLGDVFPFAEIECPVCHGTGQVVNDQGQLVDCNHPDGTFKSLKVLNPDYVIVQDNVLADEPLIALKPDEELRLIIQRQQPSQIYNKLPPKLIDLVAAGRPIPLSNRSVSHIRHNASPYGTYGESMIRRLFTILAYKTKIMTANWIVAERLILPVRIVKVGDKDRPASNDDIQDVVAQLAAVANDPNLTVCTHHAVDYEWVGATGKIHNITPELEQIGKEMLDGFMLNQALLNGEMSSYSSSQVGVETLIRRLDNWRNKLSEWVEEHIFLPLAMMQGFIDEEKSKELNKTVYLYPKMKWNDMNLRDNSQYVQLLLQAYDKQLVSAQTILENMDLDYDIEVEKMREEQTLASETGMVLGNQQQGGGLGGALGGDLGGMPMGGGGGMPPMDMGGMEGMGGETPEAAMGEGGMGTEPAISAQQNLPKITKRGKKSEEPEQAQPRPPQMIKLTKLEQKMLNLLRNMDVPYKLYAQYQVQVPGKPRPYILDFAYPQIGVGVESDGGLYHDRIDFVLRDRKRDQELANIGWRILRFKESAISDDLNIIGDIIYKNIVEASKEHKKASQNKDSLIKLASIRYDFDPDSWKDYKINVVDLPNNVGQMILIGE